MTISPHEAAELLGRALREDRLAVLVGSRASADSEDASGRSYRGLPTPGQFVDLCSSQFSYVDKSDDFNSAADKIIDLDGRAVLEEVLLRYYRVPSGFEPPPAHRILAWLPVALFLTSNYDQFIELCLEREGRNPRVLVEDSDLVRLKRWQTPVIKYHGCVARPETMVAATPDYEKLEQRRQLLARYIAASLAGKSLLVVGHGLADHDLSRIVSELCGTLGEYAPTVYVLRPDGHSGRIPGLSFTTEVVAEGLTAFLSRLLQVTRRSAHTTIDALNEGWMGSAFFAALRKAAVLPSETQVIDAFLAHLLEEVSARDNVQDVVNDANGAVQLALEERPNFEALRKTWADVTSRLKDLEETADAELVLREVRNQREATTRAFGVLGASLIKRNERVMLYSQSQRVIQCLLGVPPALQRTIHLFVSECRPKSPGPYQDAIATCQQLADTYYDVTVCPDVVCGYLLSSHQIDRVVLGTHAIFRSPENGAFHSFVNTCGSGILTAAALQNAVRVDVVGEALKVEALSEAAAADHVHIHQENDLLESAVGLKDLRTRRGSISHLNIGYDLVAIRPGVQVHVPDESVARQPDARSGR